MPSCLLFPRLSRLKLKSLNPKVLMLKLVLQVSLISSGQRGERIWTIYSREKVRMDGLQPLPGSAKIESQIAQLEKVCEP